MRREKTIGYVCFATMIALTMLSHSVLAASVVIAQGKGITWIRDSPTPYCDATVWGGATGNPIRTGDDAVALYNIWWWDNRTAGSTAVHYFNMTVTYSRYTGDLYAEKRITVGPGNSGSDVLNITIYSVESPSTIGVVWRAWISSESNPQCYAEDSDSVLIYL